MANQKPVRSYRHVHNSRLLHKVVQRDRSEQSKPASSENWLVCLFRRLFNQNPIL